MPLSVSTAPSSQIRRLPLFIPILRVTCVILFASAVLVGWLVCLVLPAKNARNALPCLMKRFYTGISRFYEHARAAPALVAIRNRFDVQRTAISSVYPGHRAISLANGGGGFVR